MAPPGLSVVRAAEVLGVRRVTLSNVANGNAKLAPEIALRIEMVSTPPRNLISLRKPRIQVCLFGKPRLFGAHIRSES